VEVEVVIVATAAGVLAQETGLEREREGKETYVNKWEKRGFGREREREREREFRNLNTITPSSRCQKQVNVLHKLTAYASWMASCSTTASLKYSPTESNIVIAGTVSTKVGSCSTDGQKNVTITHL